MYKFIDILGSPVQLIIQTNSSMKTYFGAFMSVFLFFIGFGAFLGFGIGIFYKEKPRVIFDRNINSALPHMNIDETNFLFTVYDQFSDKLIPDFNRRFTISFDYTEVADGSYKRLRRIPFEKCSEDVLKLWDGYFSLIPKESYLCFPKGKKWPLKGIDNQGNFTRIRMQMEYCMNNTNPEIGALGSECIPKEDTVEFLRGKRIQMHYIIQNWLINTFDFENPGTKTAYTGYTNTDALSWARLTILFKEINTDTDEGYFIVSKKNEKFTAVESIINEAIYSPDSPAVFSHLIGYSRYRETYTRSYIKIQEVFAMMGGFLSLALFLLKTVVKKITFPSLVNIFNSIIKYEHIEDVFFASTHNPHNTIFQSKKSNFITNTCNKNSSILENKIYLYNNELSGLRNLKSIKKNENINIDGKIDTQILNTNIKNILSKNYKKIWVFVKNSFLVFIQRIKIRKFTKDF